MLRRRVSYDDFYTHTHTYCDDDPHQCRSHIKINRNNRIIYNSNNDIQCPEILEKNWFYEIKNE